MYRLKIVDLNGTITYSNIVTLVYGTVNNAAVNPLTIYPNPAKTAVNLSIQSLAAPAGDVHSTSSTLSLAPVQGNTIAYNVQIVNNLGVVMKVSSTSSQSWQADVSTLTPGVYIIQVLDNKSKALVGKGTFVKL